MSNTMATKDSTATTKKRTKRKTAPSAGEGTARRKTVTGKKLVVVESPAKAKTINKYLGSDYIVKASVGHVRDLPERGLGVEIEEGFVPTYELVQGRKKVVNELLKLASKSESVYLATDLDREGEAIAWHLCEALELDPDKTHRVVFNEITKNAIQAAFSNPHGIDMDKVNAQQARRILDRIVGYELSPLLWKKIAKGLSAGRVQSVAARMIVDREKEIRAFVPAEYWTVTGYFAMTPADAERLEKPWDQFVSGAAEPDNGRTQKEITRWLNENQAIKASLVSMDGKAFKPEGRYDASAGGDKAFESAVAQARQVAEALGVGIENAEQTLWDEYAERGLKTVDLVGSLNRDRLPPFQVADIQKRRTSSRPNPPFTTATLQQSASSQMGFSTSRTMQLAQKLYEGVELPGEDGPVALITYMRTDSTNLSKDSLEGARTWIGENCGKRYLPAKPNVYGSKKRAQEAHEAIRPTEPSRTPESVKGQLRADLYKLYDLIWRRFTGCQMTPAEWDSTTVLIHADTKVGVAEFKASGRTLAFDGFYKVAGLPKSTEDQLLPPMTTGQDVGAIDIETKQNFTSPPSRYSEAALVKRMEAEGIGRPSTYAAIIKTIQDRGYVEQIDRRFYATDKGVIVTEKLIEHFPDIMDLKFTSFMEDELDKIEEAHLDWVKVLHEFYDPFHRDLVRAHDEMTEARAEPSEYKCDQCGGEMVYRWGKTGRFLSCTKYPECKGAHNIDREGKPIIAKPVDAKCELCGKEMILRQSRHGSFLGCSGYPECNSTIACDAEGVPLKLVTEKELEEPCTACGEGTLKVKRKGFRAFLGCDRYPECKETHPLPEDVRLERKVEPVEEAGFNCERCGKPMRIKAGRRGKFIACSGFPRCRNTKPIEKLEELKAAAPAQAETPAGNGKANGAVIAPEDLPRKPDGKVDIEALGPPPKGYAWTRTGKPVVETWPEEDLHCPQCGNTMQLKSGRFGPFYSCTNYPKCRCSVNLRGQAKKQAEIEMPAPVKPKPVPTDIRCEECGELMLIRTGRSGKFLGCSAYPKCKVAKPLPVELMNMASESGGDAKDAKKA